MSTPERKGLYDGACNRGCCLKPGAKWWNYGSRAYYCGDCARLINRANHDITPPLCSYEGAKSNEHA